MISAPPDWSKDFFKGIVVEVWLRAMPEEITQQEAKFIRSKLEAAPPSRILDVPCGGGRHALALAAAGYQITGVDSSAEFLAAARSKAAERNLHVKWEQRDMSDLPWQREFDGAFCFGNSLGYGDDEQTRAFLRAVRGTLKPGAHFVLDYPAAAEALLPIFQERSWYEIGDILFLREGCYDARTGRLHSEHTYIRGSKVEKCTMSQRIFTCSELCRLLQDAGFTDIHAFGSLAGEPFVWGSTRLFLAAVAGS